MTTTTALPIGWTWLDEDGTEAPAVALSEQTDTYILIAPPGESPRWRGIERGRLMIVSLPALKVWTPDHD